VVEAAAHFPEDYTVFSSQRMNDKEILHNIKERHGWTPQDKGANGNCLFLSMALQVQPEDLKDIPSRSLRWEKLFGGDLAERWKDMRITERALLLRQMAILDEDEFIAELQALRDGGQLTPRDEWRMRELFTDMLEEFVGTNKHGLASGVMGWDLQGIYQRVRQLVSEYTPDQVYDFVLAHAQEYMEITGTEGNWAGSSEMAALSSVLKRPVLAFGNNNVTQDEVKIKELEDGGQEVLPYFEARCFDEARGEAIRVFQVNGGGHYQMLADQQMVDG